MEDFLQELVTLNYFEHEGPIESIFVTSRLLRGNLAALLRTMVSFIHQVLTPNDPNFYSITNVEEGLCRHPELTVKLCEIFEAKFHPQRHHFLSYQEKRKELLALIEQLDTGQAVNDLRRKHILWQGVNFIDHTLKTNFYRTTKTSFSFRLDPKYLDHIPYDRKEIFPVLPFGIFFVKNIYFIGFHIRFVDLARGGVRTVIPETLEKFQQERNTIFSECYSLAFTQQKKNKDIPEGGAKAVILLEPFERMRHEALIYQKELEASGLDSEQIQEKLYLFKKEQKLEYLYQSQRSFVNSFLTIINCEEDGTLKADKIIDYWKKPEYIYLGPDENMHEPLINWIAFHSEKHGYKMGKSFITSKSALGINHKEYGVTSQGVAIYMHEALSFLGICASQDPFTIKISGGPDGDVAGNMIIILAKTYPKTAKLLALTDISGTIYDPEGLNLQELVKLFNRSLPIASYPAELLSEGGFLLDLSSKKEQTAYTQVTLCYRKKGGGLVQDWLTGNETHHLYREHLHKVKTDIFIPCGGRPKTLHDQNYTDFLDDTGKPTSKAIIEGANLYLTPLARKALEKLGTLIIKDSSANKGGVICSSFEVLATLTLSEGEFLKIKNQLVAEILQLIKKAASDEAHLLLNTFKKRGGSLTDISDNISDRINLYKFQLLGYLEKQSLPKDLFDPLLKPFFKYLPPLLRDKVLLEKIPEIHIKSVIACYIASHLVYNRGLDWAPTLVDIFPLIINI